MAAPKRGLGKGIDSLIPSQAVPVKTVEGKVEKGPETMVKITMVEPNREQPRKNFDEDALQELADSIKQFGLLQPILVQDRKSHYEIIAGERRWRASKLAGLKEVPVIIKDYTEQEIVEISLIENIQRENLNPIEEAQAYDETGVNERIEQAVRETRGMVLSYQGQLPYAWFHAHSGGMTELAVAGLGWDKAEPSYTQVVKSTEPDTADDAQALRDARNWAASSE